MEPFRHCLAYIVWTLMVIESIGCIVSIRKRAKVNHAFNQIIIKPTMSAVYDLFFGPVVEKDNAALHGGRLHGAVQTQLDALVDIVYGCQY